jgi:hypothetical protein
MEEKRGHGKPFPATLTGAGWGREEYLQVVLEERFAA